MSEIRAETEANNRYILEQGYTLDEMKECDWLQLKRSNPIVRAFLGNRFKRPLDNVFNMTMNQVIQGVLDEKLFGVVECDIHVPDHLKPNFSEMCPIFKNTEISRDDIGEFMKEFAEEVM